VPLRLALFALALLALAPLAFWPAYVSRLAEVDTFTHVHAVLGTCWLLLLTAQPLLINASQRSAHRLVGRFGLFVGAAFFLSGLLIAQRSVARMSLEQFARDGRFVYLPLAMAIIFVAALVLAALWRHSAAAHGRFMVATALPLLDPLFARLLFSHAPPLPVESLYQVPAFAVSMGVLWAMFVSLPRKSPARRSFLYFSAGATALLLGFFVVPHTAAWHSFATWFRALPIT
jgi:hypothetical protein